jgi:expansin (peptidoglycan-binding protein)
MRMFRLIFFFCCLVININCQISKLFSVRQSGDGTYYGANNGAGGACSIYPKPSFQLNTVAINAPQWAGSGACGMCVQVSGSGQGQGGSPITGTEVYMVDNLCPECKTGSLDLAKNGDGRWKINWIAVPCPTKGGLTYKFQGSQEWYLKMQVGNHKIPVQAVQFGKNGKWFSGTRTSDNFWIPSGYPYPASFPLSVRVQGINNQWVEDVVPSLQTTPVSGKGVQFSGISGARATEANSTQYESGTSASPSIAMIVVTICAILVVAGVVAVIIVMIFRRQDAMSVRP